MIQSLTIEPLSSIRRWLPKDVAFWLKAIILALIAIQIAKLLWVMVTPVGPFSDWRPAPPRNLSSEAQAAVLAAVDPFFPPGAMAAAATAQAAPLDLQLFGIRGSRGKVPGSAILGPPDGEQQGFLVGEEVAPGVKLAAVHFDHVVLESDGARQSLYMEGADQGAGGASSSPASAPAAAVVEALDLKPRKQGDRVTGVTVAPGPDQSLFASAGFRSGDVIVAVNGARITSVIDVQQLQSSIAPGARLLLTVERGAETVPIALNLPGNR